MQVPKANGLCSLSKTHASTAKNEKSAWNGVSFSVVFFFFLFFLKKHICAAISVQRVRTQNKYVIGNSERFTVSKA